MKGLTVICFLASALCLSAVGAKKSSGSSSEEESHLLTRARYYTYEILSSQRRMMDNINLIADILSSQALALAVTESQRQCILNEKQGFLLDNKAVLDTYYASVILQNQEIVRRLSRKISKKEKKQLQKYLTYGPMEEIRGNEIQFASTVRTSATRFQDTIRMCIQSTTNTTPSPFL